MERRSHRTYIEDHLSGVHDHGSLGIDGKVHELLRSIFKNAKLDFSAAKNNTLLFTDVNAMSHATGVNGGLLSQLIFGAAD